MDRRLGRRVVTVLIGAFALAIGPFLWSQGAQGGPVSEVAPQGIVVVGDSITARYDDSPGDADQGWWSVVARHYGADVTTYAQSGSGYLRQGLRCTGDRFGDRDAAFEGSAPSLFIVEGGRNDWSQCVDGRWLPSTNAEVERAVERYYDRIDASFGPATRVVVLGPPWGPLQLLEGLRITRIVKAAVERHGFEFVDTAGTLTAENVVDGIHPNRAGSLAIADRVIATVG